MQYPGGKNGSGVYQKIINQMPPHKIYVEPFLGGGAVMRYKRPAGTNIGIDKDPEAINLWVDCEIPDFLLFQMDALTWLGPDPSPSVKFYLTALITHRLWSISTHPI